MAPKEAAEIIPELLISGQIMVFEQERHAIVSISILMRIT